MLRDVSRAGSEHDACSAPRCPRRCCSRRSACSRSSTRRPSSRRRARPATLGLPFILSTAASHSIEQVAEAMGEASRWYQLYWPRDRDLALRASSRAPPTRLRGDRGDARHVDARLAPARPEQRVSAVSERRGRGQLLQRPGLPRRRSSARPRRTRGRRSATGPISSPTPAITWDDLAWLREQTELPIVLKGIVHADDARARAGGRGRADRLQPRRPPGRRGDRRARRAAGGPRGRRRASSPVLFDSGIRTGADVFKALALGADAVCLGRPYVWGLALDGQAGVEAGAALPARRARPDARAERLHDDRSRSTGARCGAWPEPSRSSADGGRQRECDGEQTATVGPCPRALSLRSSV